MERLVTPIIASADKRHECMSCGRSYDNSAEVSACWAWHEDGNPGPIPAPAYAPTGTSWRKTVQSGGWKAPGEPLQQKGDWKEFRPSTHDCYIEIDMSYRPNWSPQIALPTLTDHAAACAELLRKQLVRLEQGAAPEDIGPEIVLIGRMMARRT